jgi:hypothetical protein
MNTVAELVMALCYHGGHIMNKTEGMRNHRALWEYATPEERTLAREQIVQRYVGMGFDMKLSESLADQAAARIAAQPRLAKPKRHIKT